MQRMLDTQGLQFCEGESGRMLEHLMAAEAARAGVPGGWRREGVMEHGVMERSEWLEGHRVARYGMRSSFFGRDGWEGAVAKWSWLLRDPGAVIVFVVRNADEQAQLSVEWTWPLWVPSFAKCIGRVWKRWKRMRQHMLDFHEMNPARTVVLRMEEFGDFRTVERKLRAVGLEASALRWKEAMDEQPGRRDVSDEIFAQVAADKRESEPQELPEALGDEDPFSGEEFQEEDVDPFEGEEHGMLEAHRPVPEGYKPGRPRPFIESPARHARAIVYPWLATGAVWDELRYSLRSVEKFFADKECPIYILGDAPPPWLRPGGRVQWIAIQGYAASRREGMWQAQVTGVQLAEEVCWMNDDIYFLRETGWEDLRVALTEGRLEHRAGGLMESANIWQVGLGRAVADLQMGLGVEQVWRFATHTPFLFERDKSVEVLRHYKLAYKGSWVTLYHNHHKTPHRPVGRLKARRLPAGPEARYLNHPHKGPGSGSARELEAMFPEAAPWEMDVPRIIHQIWSNDDSEIPRDVYPEEWTASWKALHPQWEYRLWSRADLQALAASDYPEFAELFAAAREVVKADVGRLLILHKHGGLYADLDYLALKPMDDLVRGGSLWVNTLEGGYTHNALMAGVAGHRMWLAAAREALKRWRAKPKAAPEWIGGPSLVQEMAAKFKARRWAGSQVCPLDWQNSEHEGEWRDLLARCGGAHAVTFWSHNW